MSFAHYEIAAGASIHEHHHPHEEVWTVIEGQLEVTHRGADTGGGAGRGRGGAAERAPLGESAERGLAVIANHPVRHDFL